MHGFSRTILLVFCLGFLLLPFLAGCSGASGGNITAWDPPTIGEIPYAEPPAGPVNDPEVDPEIVGTVTGTLLLSDGSGDPAADLIRADQPIAGAAVSTDLGASTITDANGNFTLTNVPAGLRIIWAQGLEFKTVAQTTVVVPEQVTDITLVTSPRRAGDDEDPVENEAQLSVVTHGYWFADNVWAPVSQERAWEINDYSNRWYNLWESDWPQSEYTLTCQGVKVGTWYRIKVYWSEDGQEMSETYDYQVQDADDTFTNWRGSRD